MPATPQSDQRRRKACHRKWSAGNGIVPGDHRGDIMTPETRSALMARIRGKDTSPELLVRAELKRCRIAFTTHDRRLPGCPDVIINSKRIAVFVDGDFWHGWRFPLWKHKLSPKWQDKITATRIRDRRNFRKLRRQGWRVVRIWEHQIECDPGRCVERLLRVIRQRTSESQLQAKLSAPRA